MSEEEECLVEFAKAAYDAIIIPPELISPGRISQEEHRALECALNPFSSRGNA